MFEHSQSESLRNVSVTKIGYTLSYDFPQTENRFIVTAYSVFVLDLEILCFSEKRNPFYLVKDTRSVVANVTLNDFLQRFATI